MAKNVWKVKLQVTIVQDPASEESLYDLVEGLLQDPQIQDHKIEDVLWIEGGD